MVLRLYMMTVLSGFGGTWLLHSSRCLVASSLETRVPWTPTCDCLPERQKPRSTPELLRRLSYTPGFMENQTRTQWSHNSYDAPGTHPPRGSFDIVSVTTMHPTWFITLKMSKHGRWHVIAVQCIHDSGLSLLNGPAAFRRLQFWLPCGPVFSVQSTSDRSCKWHLLRRKCLVYIPTTYHLTLRLESIKTQASCLKLVCS